MLYSFRSFIHFRNGIRVVIYFYNKITDSCNNTFTDNVTALVLYEILISLFRRETHGSEAVSKCKWEILPLHSTITVEEQRKVFVPPKPGHRKVILATNIAESSITVPDITYGKLNLKTLFNFLQKKKNYIF